MARTFKYTYGYEPYETLPPVSAEDNGKVLGVSEGQYALVSGGGGGGTSGMVVDEPVGEDNVPYIDCPSSELYEAFNNGTHIVVRGSSSGATFLMQLCTVLHSTQDGNDMYTFFVERVDLTGSVVVEQFMGINDTPPIFVNGDDPSPGPDPSLI